MRAKRNISLKSTPMHTRGEWSLRLFCMRVLQGFASAGRLNLTLWPDRNRQWTGAESRLPSFVRCCHADLETLLVFSLSSAFSSAVRPHVEEWFLGKLTMEGHLQHLPMTVLARGALRPRCAVRMSVNDRSRSEACSGHTGLMGLEDDKESLSHGASSRVWKIAAGPAGARDWERIG